MQSTSGAAVPGAPSVACLSVQCHSQTPTPSSQVAAMPFPLQPPQSTKKDSRTSRNASFSRTPTIQSNATVTVYHPEQPAASVAEFRPVPATGSSTTTVPAGSEEQQSQCVGGAPNQESVRPIGDDPSAAEGSGETRLVDPDMGRCRGMKRLTLDAPIEEWRSRSSSRTSRDFRAALSEDNAREVRTCTILEKVLNYFSFLV